MLTVTGIAQAILHPRLLGGLAGLGHGHTCAVVDAGLPLPHPGRAAGEVVDLSLVAGEPTAARVVAVILDTLAWERLEIADELVEGPLAHLVTARAAGQRAAIVRGPHHQLRPRLAGADLVIRTGECTPYHNVLIHAGVSF